MFQPTQLAENGPTCSRLVWGVMKWGVWGRNFDARQMLQCIERGVELGITTFDHADIYGDYTTEATFGEALRQQPALREKIQLVTKCGIRLVTPNRAHHRLKSYDTSLEHIRWSVEQSLKNLRTDYLDLVLIHRPDPLMVADDVGEVFRNLQEEGKVRHFGVSNFSPETFDLLNSRFPLATNQVQASAVHLDPFFDGTFDQLQRYRIRPMAWSPLGGGDLLQPEPPRRNWQRWWGNAEAPRTGRLRAAAHRIAYRREETSFDQVLLAWLLFHPAGILPVLGTTRPERLERAIAAANIQLTREEWFEILEASRGQEVA